ncbi:hypothetical protein SAMN04488527_10462 [Aliiroseovarius crassostreae]|nr:hypothetical protein SAMN04488527_10462 [Aliiroseovarius crassostreae]
MKIAWFCKISNAPPLRHGNDLTPHPAKHPRHTLGCSRCELILFLRLFQALPGIFFTRK